MSSTDSASVFAILRSQKMELRHNLRPMLELESGSNDPMAYMLTLVLLQFLTSDGFSAGEMAKMFVVQMTVGCLMGYILGRAAVMALNRLNIDNHGVENAIRPLALGRKNYLFCGNHDAAVRAAIVYSLFACCKAHDVEIRPWLEDTLRRLPTEKDITALLPENWQPVTAK